MPKCKSVCSCVLELTVHKYRTNLTIKNPQSNAVPLVAPMEVVVNYMQSTSVQLDFRLLAQEPFVSVSTLYQRDATPNLHVTSRGHEPNVTEVPEDSITPKVMFAFESKGISSSSSTGSIFSHDSQRDRHSKHIIRFSIQQTHGASALTGRMTYDDHILTVINALPVFLYDQYRYMSPGIKISTHDYLDRETTVLHRIPYPNFRLCAN